MSCTCKNLGGRDGLSPVTGKNPGKHYTLYYNLSFEKQLGAVDSPALLLPLRSLSLLQS